MKGNLIFGIVAKNEPESAARLRCPLDKERAGLVSGAMQGLLAPPRVFANTFSPRKACLKNPPATRFAEIYHAPGKVYPHRAQRLIRPTQHPGHKPQASLAAPRHAHPRKAHLKIFPAAHPHWATRVPPHKSRAPAQRPSFPHNAYPYNKKRNARFWQAFRKCSSCNLIRRQPFQPFSFQ